MKRIIVHKTIRSFRIAAKGILFILFTLIGAGILIALLGVAAKCFYSKDLWILGAIFTVGVLIVFFGEFIYLIERGIICIIRLVSKKKPEKIKSQTC